MDPVMMKGLPANIAVEKLVLGSILLCGARFPEIASALDDTDFALEKHRRIFARMRTLDDRGEKIDRVTIADDLNRTGELASVDGLSYLVSLDDGLPQISNLDSYIDILIQKSRLRRIAVAGQSIMNHAIAGTDSPDEVLAGADAALLGIRPSRNTKETWKTPGMEIADYPGGLKGLLDPEHSAGIQTPFAKLNEVTGGFRPQELILIAGRPSHGKSALALQFGWHAVKHQEIEVAYISLEMSRESITRRLISMHGRADLHRMRIGYLSFAERQRVSECAADVSQACLWIDERGGQTSASIRRSVRELCARRPIGMVIVDHLHLIRSSDFRGEDERKRFSRIADDLQALAKELNVPVLALAQLSRRCEEENRAPGMPDLKETGKLEENADLILCPYRPEMYHRNREKKELKGIAEIVIPKQRNGPIGSVYLVFTSSMSMFQNRTEDAPKDYMPFVTTRAKRTGPEIQ
jgi:replicative DNA helicase